MKAETYKTIGAIIVVLSVLEAVFNETNLGFIAMNNAEDVGYNIGRLIFPIFGLILYVIGTRKAKKENRTV